MCIYALYRYRNCEILHPLGNGPRGGRAFRIRPCQLNMMANDELKDSSKSKHRIYDHALPCEGEECRVYYIDQICHVCNPREALAAGYPLNKNYGLTVAHVLEWSIPHNQMRFDDFREISYTDPKKDAEEEQPVSPKGLFREINYNSTRLKTDYDTATSPKGVKISLEASGSLEYSAIQRSEFDNEANRRILSTASDNSTSSQNELRPQRLQVRPVQQTPHRTASVSPSSEYRVRIAAPVPFEMHSGDSFFESY